MSRSFATALKDHNLELIRKTTETLQINVGLRCNLSCKHCHLSCGPRRNEYMRRETMDDVAAFAGRHHFKVADITGGAPELVPDLPHLIEKLAPLVDKVLLRSNLTLLPQPEYADLLACLKKNRVSLVASFPSTNENQTNGQRGTGVWRQTIDALLFLNEHGYGMEGSGLELILVSNPTGAFLPVSQCSAEKKFKADLARKWGIRFTTLLTFANVPLGRFKAWLERSGNYQSYIGKLEGGFNPATVDGLMCTSLISISWDGYLYDCDFNQAAELPFSSKAVYVGDMARLDEGLPIATGNHCFSCTAGSGFT